MDGGSIGGRVGPAEIVLLGLAFDAVAGDLRWLFRAVPHPVAALGAVIAALEARLNRPSRGAVERRWRGVLAVALVVILAAAAGWLAQQLCIAWRWGFWLEAAIVGILVAQRSLHDHVAAVGAALAAGDLAAAREAVGHIVGRDPESLDAPGIARAAIESLFENFADGVVAPVFWYVLLGLPGLCALKAVNTLDSMIGHRDERHRDFGAAAARLDTACMFVPARLAGAIVALSAAFVPRASPAGALATMRRDAARHRSVNAGWPEAAAAGALGVALAGPRSYGGRRVDDSWIGDGKRDADAADIGRARALFAVACLVHAALAACVLLLIHG